MLYTALMAWYLVVTIFKKPIKFWIAGEFYKPLKETVGPGEKRQPIRHSDQIPTGEGEFYQRPKETLQQGERRQPIIAPNNLKPEGEFYQRPEQGAPLKGDRADVKKPIDNLRPEGMVC